MSCVGLSPLNLITLQYLTLAGARGVPAIVNGLNLTLDHMENPLEKNNFENRVFFYVREDQKIGLAPNFHELRSSDG